MSPVFLERLLDMEVASNVRLPPMLGSTPRVGMDAGYGAPPTKRACLSLRPHDVSLARLRPPALKIWPPPVLRAAVNKHEAQTDRQARMIESTECIGRRSAGGMSAAMQACPIDYPDLWLVDGLAGSPHINTVVMPSGGEASGSAVSITRPCQHCTDETQKKVLHCVDLEPLGRTRQEQGHDWHQFLIKQLAAHGPMLMSPVEVDSAMRRADIVGPVQSALVAGSCQFYLSDDGSSCDDDGEEYAGEAVQGVLGSAAPFCGRGIARRTASKRKVSHRCQPFPSLADGDSAGGIVIKVMHGSVSGQKGRDDSGAAGHWIRRLDVKRIMDGGIDKPLVLLRRARQAHQRMMERGEALDAARLEAHLHVSAAASELSRYKHMPHDELLDVIDVLEEAGLQVPDIIGIEILRAASQRLPGPNAPDAANMLDMLWMWPLTSTVPKFHARSPKLASLCLSMSDKVAAFKSFYVDHYLGALLAMGPGKDIEEAAGLFLERWDNCMAAEDEDDAFCHGWEAAKGVAPGAQRHSDLLER